MTISYQHDKHIPASRSDSGESARTCGQLCAVSFEDTGAEPVRTERSLSAQKKPGRFSRHDRTVGDSNDTPVALHIRQGGQSWVVSSKTPEKPVRGCGALPLDKLAMRPGESSCRQPACCVPLNASNAIWLEHSQRRGAGSKYGADKKDYNI